MTYITVPCVIFAANNADDSQSFSDRIKTLQDETGYLFSYIEGTSLVTTKEFITSIQDAHTDCPNLKEMEVSLANIATQADTYHFYVTKQLSDCKALLYMLKESLDNGGLVDYYLKEGNYSLVTSTIDKWHQSFLNFRSEFYLTNTPLDIILSNKKIFFYDNWFGGIAESALTLIVLLIMSMMAVKVFTSMGLIVWIITLFSPPSTDSHRRKLSIDSDSPQVEVLKSSSESRDPHQRKPNRGQQLSSEITDTKQLTSNRSKLDKRNVTSSSATSVSHKLYTTVTIVVWFTVLCGLIVIAVLWYPSKISFSKSSRYNWYPDATAAMEKMRVDRDKVQSNVSRQILSIEKLQSYANMYHDETIQADADELIRNLGRGIRQASKEVSEVYMASEKLPSTFRRAYTDIETKAKKAGRLVEANKLLVALNKTSETYEKFLRSVQVLMVNQQELLPILKEQTQTMQALVQQGHVMDINRIVKEHINTIMHIDGYAYQVEIVVKQLVKIAENDGSDGMKKAIEELKDQTVTDQYKAMLYGAAGGLGGSLGGAVLGTVAIKSGYAIVSITATAIAGPIAAAVGGVGLLGFAAFSVARNFDNYQDASRYKTELDIIETQRRNLYIAMNNLKTAVIDQQTASKATQTALNNIATHSASFSDIPGFILPTEKRTALSNELLHIIQQYNTMISVFNSFKTYTVDNDQELLSA